MLDAEMATLPATEFEPGRFTPPPASIAKFGAVSTAPVTAVTDPGVTIFRFVTFADKNVELAATVTFPEAVLPIWSVVALRNVFPAAGIARAEADASPRTMPRPAVR